MSDRLDEIFADFYAYDSEKEHISMPVARAKQALQSYIDTKIILELQSILRFGKGDVVSVQTVADRVSGRLAELTALNHRKDKNGRI